MHEGASRACPCLDSTRAASLGSRSFVSPTVASMLLCSAGIVDEGVEAISLESWRDEGERKFAVR